MKMNEFTEPERLILTSILNERCSVAISTDKKVQLIDLDERNKKKLTKLKENLKSMIDYTTSEKYVKKTKPPKKERDLTKVRSYIFLKIRFEFSFYQYFPFLLFFPKF